MNALCPERDQDKMERPGCPLISVPVGGIIVFNSKLKNRLNILWHSTGIPECAGAVDRSLLYYR